MLDTLAKFSLSFSQVTFIAPLVVWGYIWLDRKVFFDALCLILVSIVFNYALKITFQVPLSPSLGKEGFAFPSGHMQASLVFYGWLILQLPNRFWKMVMIGLLVGIGLSLVYCGFHTYYDIFGALFFATLLIGAYWILTNAKKQVFTLVLLSFSTVLMLYIASRTGIKEYVWRAYYTLMGITISQMLFTEKLKTLTRQSKILAILLCFLAALTTKILFATEYIASLPIFLNQIQAILFGFYLPASVFISYRIISYVRPSYVRR